ncbi:hypothetical protein EV589_1167 [Mycobacterium sp. BK558]|uniref:Uncharacterized protein n=1 Tax=Mycolicibacterium chlorophenolicum TaxID=37916 RepID=A0A0J6VEG2_9MYCO|nr:hypothetical protein [Mycolicibacterium chlorophenolicum]KMO67933.1 hypothetical protein MCHLDSM_07190 [Mycolicibacterium chlorophenolicum]MBI5336682.1 hypothetical protein [Mycolicibacterium rufum]RZT25433.1 hypothetical protein EV589_1167 [Mycobacterium sp. BK558]
MEANELSQLLLASPLSAVPAAVMVVLTALTMRSVIKREQAMLPQRRPSDVARASYVDRWRTRP